MTDLVLSLGGVAFVAFEVPEEIAPSLRHAVQVHKKMGGERVVDAMGADYDPIVWRGVFRGPNAEARARQLETMAAGGAEQVLTWSGYYYRVIVTGFRARFLRRYEIPYEIECTVIEAPGQGGGGFASLSLDDVVGPDLAALAAYVPPIAAAADAVAGLAGVAAAAGPLDALSDTGLNPMRQAAAATVVTIRTAVVQGDVILDTAQDAPADLPAGLAAARIALAAADAARGQADLVEMAALAGRVVTNLDAGQAIRG